MAQDETGLAALRYAANKTEQDIVDLPERLQEQMAILALAGWKFEAGQVYWKVSHPRFNPFVGVHGWAPLVTVINVAWRTEEEGQVK